jgi:hypothetical protein
MNYLSQYYKNLSEQIQEKIKNLEYLLKEDAPFKEGIRYSQGKEIYNEADKLNYTIIRSPDQLELEYHAMNPSGGKSNKEKRKDFEHDVTNPKLYQREPSYKDPKDVPTAIDPNTGNEYSPIPKEETSPDTGRKPIYPGSLQDIQNRMQKDNTTIIR